jgi:hypothetical protein
LRGWSVVLGLALILRLRLGLAGHEGGQTGLCGEGLNDEEAVQGVTLLIVELAAHLRGVQPGLALCVWHLDGLVEGAGDGALAILG